MMWKTPGEGRLSGVLLVFVFLGPAFAVPAWQTQVRILTDVPNAKVYVDGEFAALLDNSMFSLEEEKWNDINKTEGGYGAYVDLKDFESHKITVGISEPVRNEKSFIVKVHSNMPIQTIFVPLMKGTWLPVPRRSSQSEGAIPLEADKSPAYAAAVKTWHEISWLKAGLNWIKNWVGTPAGAVSLIFGAALCQALVLIVVFWKSSPPRGVPAVVSPGGATLNQVHVPTIIGHGWPYVMLERYPNIKPIQKIGAGGVASVFLAEVPKTGYVAIKILHEHQSSVPDLRKRFLQEARILLKLAKTGVVPLVHGMSPKDFHRPWFMMTYLGQMYRLRDMIGGKEHKRLVLDWAYPVAAALCASVDAIHLAGVIHRDLSPENVMFGFGVGMEVRLIDFDSAKMHGANLSRAELAEAGANGDVVGKVKYTSPEQWQNFDSAGVESDAYSVGVMIWEMITGSPPFKGSTIDEIREQHLTAPRDVAELTRFGVPGQLAAMLTGLLDPDPARRPQLSVIRTRLMATIGGANE